VADNPAGPYKDYLGKPLIGEIYNGAQPIDQFVFKDVDGQYYMIYGGWSHCNVAKLKDDFTGFIPFEDGTTFREVTPEGYVEGPFMFRKDGRYYFMWSEGGWTGPNYSVAYAIADSPLGPFKRIGRVLQQDPQVGRGAGHHSVIHDEQADIWYAVYHRRPLTETDGNHRVTCIDRMYFDEKGLIQPIKITKEGVEKRTLQKPQAGTFTNPLNAGADPWMLYYEGNYYLTTTQGSCIRMWKAPTLEGLKTAKGVTVWKDDDPTRSHGVWAPEFHSWTGNGTSTIPPWRRPRWTRPTACTFSKAPGPTHSALTPTRDGSSTRPTTSTRSTGACFSIRAMGSGTSSGPRIRATSSTSRAWKIPGRSRRPAW
jgi:hypothetical protein